MTYIGNDNDESYAGHLSFFNPSSTTFVKHFIATGVDYGANDYANNPLLCWILQHNKCYRCYKISNV
jgi:hypothetical protein